MNLKAFYYPSLFVLVLLVSCTPFKKSSSGLTNSVMLDTVTVKANPEKPVYRGSATRLDEVIHTRLEVSFDWTKAWLFGKATLTARPWFYSSDSILLNARGMDIHQVALVNGEHKTNLDYAYTNDVLRIHLDKIYTRNDTFRIFIDYTSKPNELKKTGGSVAISQDKGLYFINPDGKDPDKPREIWTQGETASNSVWFPCIDQPNEKMTDEISITVDKKYSTLSNGELVSSRDNPDGTRTDYWNMALPHSAYLVMMAVGEFSIVKDQWRGKEVSYYMEKKYAPFARAIFGHTPEMIETFSTLLGFPFAWNKYSQVIVRDYVSGAMENTTATLFGEFMNQTAREMLDGDYEDVISHELFHHWFGDLVTCESWSNIPLNESFADYGEYIWQEHKYGRDAADAHRHRAFEQYLNEAKRNQVDLVRYYYQDQEELFDANTYEKGGCILHMLRKYVGDEAFYASLKLYLETYKFGNAEIANLRMAFEKVTGEDLNWFFNEWFFAGGHPDLKITHSYDSRNRQYTVSIDQRQDLKKSPLYRIPVDVDIYSQGKKERKRIILEKQHQDFVFNTPERPDLVDIDAEKMLVCEKEEVGLRPADLAFQYIHAPLYEDRREALTGLAKSDNAAEYMDCIIRALNDPRWEIRRLAITGLSRLPKGNESTIREKLSFLAVSDPKSNVRSAAISFLAANCKDNDLNAVYKNSLKDSSYLVITSGLYALDKRDSAESMQIASSLETEANEQVRLALLAIYSKRGGDEKNDFFIRSESDFKGPMKVNFLFIYGDFLKRCSDQTIDRALPLLVTMSGDDNKYVKYYSKKTLQDLADMYAAREKKDKRNEDAQKQKKKIEDLINTL